MLLIISISVSTVKSWFVSKTKPLPNRQQVWNCVSRDVPLDECVG